MSTITKKDLALLVSQNTGCKKNLAAKMVDSLFVDHARQPDRGQTASRFGGSASSRSRTPAPSRRPATPRTGEIIYVPARRKTHFKPGRLLKEALHRARDPGGTFALPLHLDDEEDDDEP